MTSLLDVEGRLNKFYVAYRGDLVFDCTRQVYNLENGGVPVPHDPVDHSRGLELYSLGMRAKRAEARKKELAIFCNLKHLVQYYRMVYSQTTV